VTGLATLALHAARACGLFALARRLTSGRLRILCYHGIALGDEAEFQPMLFMRASTFADRLDRLAAGRYPVLPLGEAIERLRSGRMPHAAVAVTIDDGWYGTGLGMAPALARHGFPATLYVATYYLEKQTQVFNVAAAYALWKARPSRVDLAAVDERLEGDFDLADAGERAEAARRLNALADGLVSAEARQALLENLYAELGLDFEYVRSRRMFTLLTLEEAAQLPAQGVDLQIHTHRHRFPADDPPALAAEIEDNRRALSRCGPGPFRHLCYPSGQYDRRTFPQLDALGIATATTTVPGMNTPATPPLELRRFLDSEAWPAIRFEAEVSGFLEVLRLIARRRPASAR
jgi:peptidoglycan/xylan/chitin deacetylase (PgdA/CDA1 family)